MKTKTFSLPLFTLLIITAIYFTSCKPDEQSPCSDASNTIVNLTAIELSKVPYTGFDTLYFLSKTGDTNIVVGGGKQYYYDTKYSTQPPDCPQNQTTQYQAYKINFTPTKGDLNFQLLQQSMHTQISIASKVYPILFKSLYGYIGGVSSDIDIIKINGIEYNNIFIFLSSMKNQIQNYDTSYTLYYNKSNGILLIKSIKDNEEYSIIKK
ncbi:MAG: hypothetical protein WCO28_12200 [Bacteroidota bacterium]